MGTTQKYSLKWNDFGVNVASTFRDLHSRHDFVDVTLACSDGSTMEAHKVILSSVSCYFRDILKTTTCSHPIIILKDTGREEAQAMLEFAYTGEVNVGQDLLPALLHTARSFKIKGLDKVENPIEPPAPIPLPSNNLQHQSNNPWTGVTPSERSRSHTPNSANSQQDVKPLFLTNETKAHQQPIRTRARDASPNPSVPNNSSRPPTRESSPTSASRTPPPKRWKRSFDLFDLTQPGSNASTNDEPLPMIAENYSSNRPEQREEVTKPRCFESSSSGSGRSAPYPHSMPTSPTMFERGNEIRLAGLFRHHLANNDTTSATPASSTTSPPQQPCESQSQQVRPESTSNNSPPAATSAPTTTSNQPSSSSANDYDPVDYRCYNKTESNEPARDFSARNEEENSRYRREPLVFRPESAPTVLDMSPEGSLSGPPSVRNIDLGDSHRDEYQEHIMSSAEDLSDCVSKAFNIQPNAMGQYKCEECGKIFKHPGSLQHHRHIHRGTHRCPSCGKAFSRRWDMERHLNKSKYGCPANRFSTGSTGSSGTTSSGSGSSVSAVQSTAHLQLLTAAAASNGVHNTTA